MKRNLYNTKQKQYIYNTIKNINKNFTIKDLYKNLKTQVGLTTLYRYINYLYTEGVLTKNIDESNNTYYQFIDKCDYENHFLLKCDVCKKIYHIDCNCILNFFNSVFEEHNFKINKQKIIINGICENCMGDVKC